MAKSKTKTTSSDERLKSQAAAARSLATARKDTANKEKVEKTINKVITKKKTGMSLKPDIFKVLKYNNQIKTITGKAIKTVEDLTLDFIEYMVKESKFLASISNREMVNVRDMQAAVSLTFSDPEIARFARNEGARAVKRYLEVED